MDKPDRRARVLCAGVTDAVTACLGAETSNEVRTVATLADTVDYATSTHVDCIVTASDLPDGDGLDLLSAVRDLRPDVPVVLAPETGSETLASEAIRAGVDGYYPAESDCESLVETVDSAIERHETQLQSLDRMTDAFHVLDEEWTITYINDRAREIVSEAIPPEKRSENPGLLGENLWDLVPDAVDTTFYEQYHDAMESQEPVTFREFYDPLGKWFEVRAYPSKSGLSVYFRDITEAKAYEERLQRRETVLTDIYRVIADKDRSFEQKVEKLLAIGREELGTAYGSLSRLEGDDYVFEVVRSEEGNDALSSGDRVPLSWTSCERAVTTEQTLVFGDVDEDAPELADKPGNVELGLNCYLGAPVFVDGAVTGTFCFYGPETRSASFSQWQVTLVELMANWVSYERERKRHNDALTRERNRLEEFASIVSHDLRNPLNVAMSNLTLVADDCDSEYVEKVDGALHRMDELVDDVLTLARLGKQVVDAEPLTLSAVTDSAWENVDASAATLVVDETRIVGDRSRLQRLFENLFRNAVEHGAPDVTVSVGPLEDGTGFFVADDGPGISEADRESVFEHGHTTAPEGTGFGLSIVEQIVEAHGGTVSVTESDSGGARFEIRGIETR